MLILFDHGTPAPLRAFLASHTIKRNQEMGWDSLSNGELLAGMDGISAFRQLKASAPTRSIPVMAITASAITYNRESMLAEGFNGYQIKPFNLR